MSKKWQPHAKHIVDQGVYIDEILACYPFNNKMLFDALLYNLQTLAEATQHLPDALKQQYSDIPWRRIAGFRNIVVHEYLGDIDPETVRKIVEDYLPPLKAAVAEMLAGDGDRDGV